MSGEVIGKIYTASALVILIIGIILWLYGVKLSEEEGAKIFIAGVLFFVAIGIIGWIHYSKYDYGHW